jgi:hypothetical protein
VVAWRTGAGVEVEKIAMETMTTMSKMLLAPDDYPWNGAVYLPKDRDWSLESPVAVLSPDDSEEDEDPEIAKVNGLVYVLGMSVVQDIVANAKEQKLNATPDDLFEAFMFYCNNDAFIILGKPGVSS